MLLSAENINLKLKDLHDWKQIGNAIEKEFHFKNFKEAMHFINEVAFIAEVQKHHPDWSNVYNKVHIKLTTHDFGGTTQKDIHLAAAIDAIIL